MQETKAKKTKRPNAIIYKGKNSTNFRSSKTKKWNLYLWQATMWMNTVSPAFCVVCSDWCICTMWRWQTNQNAPHVWTPVSTRLASATGNTLKDASGKDFCTAGDWNALLGNGIEKRSTLINLFTIWMELFYYLNLMWRRVEKTKGFPILFHYLPSPGKFTKNTYSISLKFYIRSPRFFPYSFGLHCNTVRLLNYLACSNRFLMLVLTSLLVFATLGCFLDFISKY